MALFMHDFIIKERFLADLRQGPHTGCTLGNITPLLATASRRCHSGTVFLLAWSLILYVCTDSAPVPRLWVAPRSPNVITIDPYSRSERQHYIFRIDSIMHLIEPAGHHPSGPH